MKHTLSRRCFLATTLAATATQSFAQSDPWQAVADQARGFDQCHALVIHQNGQQRLAEAFRGPALSRAVPIKSVSKTIVAALTGAALDRREIPSLDTPIATLAPDLIPRNDDPRINDITVEHLVTMQAGLERTSGANYGGWISSGNWVANALARPFVEDPGRRMQYSTGSFHILGAVLSEVSGESLLSLARSRLGRPLGIEIPAWTRDPQGRYLGGNEMALTHDAMIRFAEMYRLGGRWNGTQVLSADWVRRSFEPRTRSAFSNLQYGYGWFLSTSQGTEYALARGYGGQIICLAPSLGLSMALTSDPTRPARSGGYFGDILTLIEGTILPTARREMA